jgi:hypothetical protein
MSAGVSAACTGDSAPFGSGLPHAGPRTVITTGLPSTSKVPIRFAE